MGPDPLLFILGADDFEMRAIAQLLTDAGLPYAHATCNKRRIRPGETADGHNAMRAAQHYVQVECQGLWFSSHDSTAIDHHGSHERARWGPADFLRASSLGQIIELLAELDKLPWAAEDMGETEHPGNPSAGSWQNLDGDYIMFASMLHKDETSTRSAYAPVYLYGIRSGRCLRYEIPQALVLEAAADHCMAAAAAGRCPGVDPQALWEHLARTRGEALAPEMSTQARAALLQVAVDVLTEAPEHPLLPGFADLTSADPGTAKDARGMRWPPGLRMLPLAAMATGRAYIVRCIRADGRMAYRLGGAGEGTEAGTKALELWPEIAPRLGAYAVGEELPVPDANTYAEPTRGMGGATLKPWPEERRAWELTTPASAENAQLALFEYDVAQLKKRHVGLYARIRQWMEEHPNEAVQKQARLLMWNTAGHFGETVESHLETVLVILSDRALFPGRLAEFTRTITAPTPTTLVIRAWMTANGWEPAGLGADVAP